MGIKLAIIGNWGHFVNVLAETEKMPEVKVVGLCKGLPDEDLCSIQQEFRSTATAKHYDDHRCMFAEQQPDLVVISTRLDRIADFAIDAANAACHIICEKPLAIEKEKSLKSQIPHGTMRNMVVEEYVWLNL